MGGSIRKPLEEEIGKCVKKAGDTMTGKLTLSGDPTDSNHAATKKYVDDKVGGIGLPEDLFDRIFDMIYPLGSIYISIKRELPSEITGNGRRRWDLLASGTTLWNVESDSQLGQIIESALPPIPSITSTQKFANELTTFYDGFDDNCNKPRGCYVMSAKPTSSQVELTIGDSEIYGKSTVVQPPAIGVHIWKRVT